MEMKGENDQLSEGVWIEEISNAAHREFKIINDNSKMVSSK